MSETKTIRRWIWVWDFEKEEYWLNEMAQQGWALCGVGFCRYDFERCEPGEYIIRFAMEDQDNTGIPDASLAGAETVGNVMKWVYYRRKAAFGNFELLPDRDARIAHLDRITKFLLLFAAINFCIGLSNTVRAPHAGWINLVCASILTYAIGRMHGKKEALEMEKKLMISDGKENG